jgi:hypothetical protein
LIRPQVQHHVFGSQSLGSRHWLASLEKCWLNYF